MAVQHIQMKSSQNDPQIAAIAKRLREFLFRQPGFELASFASHAGLNGHEVSAALAPELGLVDPLPLIDLVVHVVRQYGVDANWLLTGDYNPATHRALDEHGPLSQFEVRRLVEQRLPSWSPSRPAIKFPA